MQILIQADMKSTKQGAFQKKHQKKRSRGQISSGFLLQMFP